jgi:type II restriction enzyme
VQYPTQEHPSNRQDLLHQGQENNDERKSLTELAKNTVAGLLDIMNCIDALGTKEFSLPELYSFEKDLAERHPNNKHIKDKIRQQLQFLRDKDYLEFVSKGIYILN